MLSKIKMMEVNVMKKPYESPEIEITEFEISETITGSGDPPGGDTGVW